MTRQRYGTGSIVEKGPGVWRLRVYVREEHRQVQRTFRGGERAAGRELAKLLTEVEAGRFDHTRATVGDLLDRWLLQLEPTRRPSTLLGYRRKLEHDIRPALGDVVLAKLRADQLDQFYRDQLARGLSTATVRQLHAILAAALHQAVKWGWLTTNPTDRASPPAVRRAPLAVPSVEAVNDLYRIARDTDPVLGTIVALAALTGARRGELCALRWSDVDLASGHLTIARAISVADGVTYVGDTKTHAARTIALDELGVTVLRDRWAEVVSLSERAGSPLVADPYVLSYQAHAGTPVSPDTISHKFATVAKLAGVDAHLHSLRHFSVTTLIAAGVDVRTVAERHGHASAVMTLNVYAGALPERDRAAAGVLGAALGAK
ncbi:MAG TPA: tyrosine-type recombinase/integrase [Acidimicrobiales bacterium]|nr:tyrosine-type recombinase/integrase [Acidimicrobiales bacterium]